MPLVSIMEEHLGSAPKQLQRLLLRLQNYDMEIRYMPGKDIYFANTFSWPQIVHILNLQQTQHISP